MQLSLRTQAVVFRQDVLFGIHVVLFFFAFLVLNCGQCYDFSAIFVLSLLLDFASSSCEEFEDRCLIF